MRAFQSGRLRLNPFWLGTLVALSAMLWAFRNVSFRQVLTLLGDLPSLAWLILLPFAFAQMTETAAWATTFRELGVRVPYFSLLRVRLSCESIAQTLPGGMMIAESIKPALMTSHCGLKTSDAVCGAASRKLLLLVSQCAYFAMAAALGLPALWGAIKGLPVGYLVLVLVALAWLTLFIAAVALTSVLRRGDICRRALALLRRVPLASVRHLAERWSSGFAKTDVRIVQFCSLGPKRLAKATLLYLWAWCWEAAETVLILRLLGVGLDWKAICLVEVCASMLRHIAFVVPAGWGVQDLGYAGLLQLFGVPDYLGVTAAFTLLKRSKELLWSTVGYVTLSLIRRRNGAHALPNAEKQEDDGYSVEVYLPTQGDGQPAAL